MLIKKMALAAVAAGLIVAGPAVADAAGDAIAAAKAAQKAAASVGGEWRDTGKIIKAAEEAAAAGDTEKAIELANKAKTQGELGKAQAMTEQGVGNPKYLYN